ncbi:MAG: type II toxin-antitoxin system prevent-host-death family antitoxin [Alphaproteobacteria bacterium]|nr:type II toxin-antitoxin system prevent-host-death family antitoxin [Alphaproteobacteria bacterium]
MSTTTISSREFNQDAGGAKKAAEKGPVIITDRGRPAHVLLSFEDYQKLVGGGQSLLEALGDPDSEDIEFEPPRLEGPLSKQVDFD